MNVQWTPYSIPLIVAGCICAAITMAASRRGANPAAYAFSVLMAFVTANIAVSFFLLGSKDLETFLFWIRTSFLGGGIGVAWLAFVLLYTGCEKKRVIPLALVLAVEPITVFVLAWLNDAHHLLWTSAIVKVPADSGVMISVDSSFGPLFWIWTAYQYTLLFIGFVLLVSHISRSAPVYRGQCLAVAVALVVPWIANALFVAKATPLRHVDLTPLAFAVSGICLFHAFYRSRFLETIPITHADILDANPNGIIVLDGHGRIADVNRTAVSILGCGEDLLLARNGVEVLPALALAVDGRDTELTLRQGDVDHYYSMHTALVGNGSGRLVFLADITEQKQLSDRLMQAGKMDALGLMAGGIAHDFNNLLTGITGNLSIMREQMESSPELDDLLGQTEQAARRAADLTRNLLTFSRNASSTYSVTDLNDLVRTTLQLIAGSIPRSITVKQDLNPDLWNVLIDPVQMSQLIMNLIINGLDAMHDYGVLSLRTDNVIVDHTFTAGHSDARTGEYVMLAVGDTGDGIPSDIRPHIFEPFFTTKPVGRGTGLGLSVAYGAARQGGGWIIVDTAAGSGSIFSTYLPRCLGELSSSSEQKQTIHTTKACHETILVVDDEQMILQLTKRMLEHRGYTVLTARDGPAALAVVADNPAAIDLVILDMTMPDMTGDQVLWRLRSLNFTSPILVSSGYALAGGMQQLLDTPGGANGFLPKPYDMGTLLDTVRSILDEPPFNEIRSTTDVLGERDGPGSAPTV